MTYYRIEGKSTGVGAFEDGKIYRRRSDGSIVEIETIRTENSGTGRHWTHVFGDLQAEDIVVQWGYSRRGSPWWSVKFVDNRPYNGKPDALDLAIQASGDPNIGRGGDY